MLFTESQKSVHFSIVYIHQHQCVFSVRRETMTSSHFRYHVILRCAYGRMHYVYEHSFYLMLTRTFIANCSVLINQLWSFIIFTIASLLWRLCVINKFSSDHHKYTLSWSCFEYLFPHRLQLLHSLHWSSWFIWQIKFGKRLSPQQRIQTQQYINYKMTLKYIQMAARILIPIPQSKLDFHLNKSMRDFSRFSDTWMFFLYRCIWKRWAMCRIKVVAYTNQFYSNQSIYQLISAHWNWWTWWSPKRQLKVSRNKEKEREKKDAPECTESTHRNVRCTRDKRRVRTYFHTFIE